MSEEMKIALIVSVAPTLAALGALIIGLRNTKKSDTIIKKADEIHTLTNSNLTNVKESLAIANDRIESLEKIIRKNDRQSKT